MKAIAIKEAVRSDNIDQQLVVAAAQFLVQRLFPVEFALKGALTMTLTLLTEAVAEHRGTLGP
jgi:hypothetical protein